MAEICDISVSELINDFIVKRTLSGSDRDNKVFHPSEFHGCKRKIAYKYFTAIGLLKLVIDESSVDVTQQLIFDNGHGVHDRYKEYLSDELCAKSLLKGYWQCQNKWAHDLKPPILGVNEKYGILRPSENCSCGYSDYEYVEVGFSDEKTNLSGHVDAVLCLPTGQHVIVDFKTIRDMRFGKLYLTADEKHNTQMQIYLFLSDLEIGKFLYENKDKQLRKEFIVVRDDNYIKRLVSYAEQLKYIVEYVGPNGQRKLPPRSNSPFGKEKDNHPDVVEYTPQNYECTYCEFKELCYAKKGKK